MDLIGLRIKILRKELGLTQLQFANRIGVTNAHVSALEKGKTAPSASLVMLICKEFAISQHWLTHGEGPMEKEIVEDELEMVIENSVKRLNDIRTRDNFEMRARVIPLEKLFIDILDLPDNFAEHRKIEYFEICYKLFFHINNFLNHEKDGFSSKQTTLFAYPDDIVLILKNDIDLFIDFFQNGTSDL